MLRTRSHEIAQVTICFAPPLRVSNSGVPGDSIWVLSDVNFSSLKHNALRLEDDFQRQGDFHMMNFMRQMEDGILEVDRSDPPMPESIDYEKSVVEQLPALWHTSIDQLVMGSLNKQEKVPIEEELPSAAAWPQQPWDYRVPSKAAAASATPP